MSYWFYQLNQKEWDPGRFRVEIWENERWSWDVLTLKGAEGTELQSGDCVAFYYAKSGGDEPGFYGWAVVLEYRALSKTLYFRPVAPTDHLKMHPWWNDEAEMIASEIRGPMARGNVWRVSDELWSRVRIGMTNWLNGRGSDISRASHAA